MKDKFFKFFEIGKLDKGLFRIWIILAIVYWAVMYYDIFNSSSYKDYKKADYYICVQDTDNHWYPATFESGASSPIIFSRFRLKKTCDAYIDDWKYNFYFLFSGVTFLPFSLIIIWLFGKKITLWVYRGFK